MAHRSVEAGADLVIGAHPHWIQSSEIYQDKPIYYSLGNFVFDQMWSRDTRTGVIALITFKKNQETKIDLLPTLIQDFCQPELIPEPEKSIIISQLNN